MIILDWQALRLQIADSVGAFLMMDMAHISGLVAAGVLNNPFEYCDVVTTTTHKVCCLVAENSSGSNFLVPCMSSWYFDSPWQVNAIMGFEKVGHTGDLSLMVVLWQSLRGPRGGMIFFKKENVLGIDLETAINNAVFPGLQVL